jgi:hypothetical protein
MALQLWVILQILWQWSGLPASPFLNFGNFGILWQFWHFRKTCGTAALGGGKAR